MGAVIDEAQGHHQSGSYINERSCSKARTLLVLMWMLFGFLLTLSYKSVLRSNMIKMEYGKAIDTIDDVLESKLTVTTCGDCQMPASLATDPRAKVKELANQFEFFQSAEHGRVPEIVEKG